MTRADWNQSQKTAWKQWAKEVGKSSKDSFFDARKRTHRATANIVEVDAVVDTDSFQRKRNVWRLLIGGAYQWPQPLSGGQLRPGQCIPLLWFEHMPDKIFSGVQVRDVSFSGEPGTGGRNVVAMCDRIITPTLILEPAGATGGWDKLPGQLSDKDLAAAERIMAKAEALRLKIRETLS